MVVELKRFVAVRGEDRSLTPWVELPRDLALARDGEVVDLEIRTREDGTYWVRKDYLPKFQSRNMKEGKTLFCDNAVLSGVLMEEDWMCLLSS